MLCLSCHTDTVPDWVKCPVCEKADAAPAPEPPTVERRPIRWGDYLAALLLAGLNAYWLWVMSTWWGSPGFWRIFWSELTFHLVLIPTAVLLLFRRTAMFGAGVALGNLAMWTSVSVPTVVDVIWREPYQDDWWNSFVLAMTAALLFFGIVWRDRLVFRVTRRNGSLAMAAVAIFVVLVSAGNFPTRIDERWDGTTFECCTTALVDAVDLISFAASNALIVLYLVLGAFSRSGAFGAGMFAAFLQGVAPNIALVAVSKGPLPAFWIMPVICAAVVALALAKYLQVERELGGEGGGSGLDAAEPVALALEGQVGAGHPASREGGDERLGL